MTDPIVLDPNAILTAFAAGPDRLEAALQGLGEAELDRALEGGGWTIRQIVHHIVDGDDIWKIFIKRAAGNPGGRFELQWYWEIPQTEWAQAWAYAGREIGPSLALYHASRGHIVQLLRQIPALWEISLLVRWLGGREQQLSVRQVVEMQTRHVDEHISDIHKILEMR